MDELTVEQRIHELWSRGCLRYKLFPDQREIYDRIVEFLDDPSARYEQFWLDVARQFGKTFTGVLVTTERAIRSPGFRALYTCSTRTGLWQFVQPNMETLLVDCPSELRPQWSSLDSSYHFPNGSQIHLAGVNNGHENDARGPKADLIVNEEFAFTDRPDYLIGSVELPMLTTTGGRIVNITTPAETPAHESKQFRDRCEAAGRYIKRTIDDNHHLSDAAKEKLIAEMGGRESTKARRELWCEWVVDESRAVIPEFAAHLDAIVQPAPAPTYETPIVAMDVGFQDFHAILYGYWWFEKAKLVVQAESFLKRATTDKIAAAIASQEAALWSPASKANKNLGKTVRWSDTDLRLIADLSELHGLHFSPTAKDDKEAQVNALRMLVARNCLLIAPSCVTLIRHLLTAVWNKQRTDFDRTDAEGHFDGVDALIYMLRNAPRYANPYPSLPPEVTPYTHHVRARFRERVSDEAEAFKEVMKGRRT